MSRNKILSKVIKRRNFGSKCLSTKKNKKKKKNYRKSTKRYTMNQIGGGINHVLLNQLTSCQLKNAHFKLRDAQIADNPAEVEKLENEIESLIKKREEQITSQSVRWSQPLTPTPRDEFKAIQKLERAVNEMEQALKQAKDDAEAAEGPSTGSMGQVNRLTQAVEKKVEAEKVAAQEAKARGGAREEARVVKVGGGYISKQKRKKSTKKKRKTTKRLCKKSKKKRKNTKRYTMNQTGGGPKKKTQISDTREVPNDPTVGPLAHPQNAKNIVEFRSALDEWNPDYYDQLEQAGADAAHLPVLEGESKVANIRLETARARTKAQQQRVENAPEVEKEAKGKAAEAAAAAAAQAAVEARIETSQQVPVEEEPPEEPQEEQIVANLPVPVAAAAESQETRATQAAGKIDDMVDKIGKTSIETIKGIIYLAIETNKADMVDEGLRYLKMKSLYAGGVKRGNRATVMADLDEQIKKLRAQYGDEIWIQYVKFVMDNHGMFLLPSERGEDGSEVGVMKEAIQEVQKGETPISEGSNTVSKRAGRVSELTEQFEAAATAAGGGYISKQKRKKSTKKKRKTIKKNYHKL